MKKLFAFIAAALLSISVAQATPQPPQKQSPLEELHQSNASTLSLRSINIRQQ